MPKDKMGCAKLLCGDAPAQVAFDPQAWAPIRLRGSAKKPKEVRQKVGT
ncbi:MAG: hypothetical protein ACYTFN_11125 [Planctomycetota bacterium]